MVVCFLNFLVVSDFMIIMVEITALNQFRSNQRKAILGVFFLFFIFTKTAAENPMRSIIK